MPSSAAPDSSHSLGELEGGAHVKQLIGATRLDRTKRLYQLRARDCVR